MRLALFCHSLWSDWNHGNAHFLRGVVHELAARGHAVSVYEPEDAWSYVNLMADGGAATLGRLRRAYPHLQPVRYRLETLELERVLDGTDLVLAHEWSEPALVAALGEWRRRHPRARLLFHDTHHRSVSDPDAMARYRLEHYDGVLAFGRVIRDGYLARGWARRAWVWHEAADVRVFRPLPAPEPEADLVWIGNWGDGERTEELERFLVRPVEALGLRATVHGVRYPEAARRRLAQAGLRYRGFLPNFEAPLVFARHRVTIHVPRRHYVESLPGIPTIRPFEALACGIPLVSAPWHDAEGLFTPGQDFLVARDGAEMARHLGRLLGDPAEAAQLAEAGRRTILRRHTCAHRVDELLAICGELGLELGADAALAQGA